MTLEADVDALALKMWSVNPRDLDAAGYIGTNHGGEYHNPRAAWYADQILALIAPLREENVRLRAALAPFAARAAVYDPPDDDDHLTDWYTNVGRLTIGDLRRARAALKGDE